MHKTLDPGLTGESGEPRRAGMMHQLESLRSAFPQDADAVDQRIVAGEESRQQRFVVDRDVERHDLSDIAQWLQELRRLGVAAANGDDLAARGEPLDDISADETRSAKHCSPAISHGRPR